MVSERDETMEGLARAFVDAEDWAMENGKEPPYISRTGPYYDLTWPDDGVRSQYLGHVLLNWDKEI